MRPTDRFENWFITTLMDDIDDTTTTFRIAHPLAVSQCRLVINPYDQDKREIVKVVSVNGLVVNVIRGEDTTSPNYFQKGTMIAMHVVAGDINDLYAEFDTWKNYIQAHAVAGPANTLSIGSVSGGATANASITGTPPNQILSLVLPKGDTGAQGPVGPAGGVNSVNTRQGDVTLTKSDVGLSNVNNTSDANKPISTATQTALNKKANTSHTHTASQVSGLGSLATKNKVSKGDIDWAAVFPIGELKYLSKGVNPNTLYPGTTWTRRTGYFLWAGADSGDYSVGKTFGSSTHTLTVAEMPSHRHSIGWNNSGGYLPANNFWANAVNVRGQINYSFSDRQPNGHNDTEFLSRTGGGQPHNNMPPARSVYLWERTA